MSNMTGPVDARSRSVRELHRLLHQVVRTLYYRAATSDSFTSLPIVQVRCLAAVADNEGLRVIDIAASTGVGVPSVSRTVETLVRRGLLSRQPSSSDRRAVEVRLTDDGRELLAEANESRRRIIEQATEEMAIEELEQTVRVLADLMKAAESVSQSHPLARPELFPSSHVDPLFI